MRVFRALCENERQRYSECSRRAKRSDTAECVSSRVLAAVLQYKNASSASRAADCVLGPIEGVGRVEEEVVVRHARGVEHKPGSLQARCSRDVVEM